MLSIGEFSKICSVTTKTLRYYDEINLIKPIHINDENGYRYYDISQLKILLTVNRLKMYELSLDEIAEIINDGSDVLLLQKISKKERELQAKAAGYELLLKTIKSDIKNLKEGVNIMSYLDKIEVKLVEQKHINYLSSRQQMSIQEFNKYFGILFERIAKEKLTITGGAIAIYHDKEFNPERSDIELGVIIAEAVKGTKDIPQSLCATIRLEGPYSELPACYAKLVQWIEKENYKIIAPPYEVYINNPCDTQPDDLVTEIYFPVKKI